MFSTTKYDLNCALSAISYSTITSYSTNCPYALVRSVCVISPVPPQVAQDILFIILVVDAHLNAQGYESGNPLRSAGISPTFLTDMRRGRRTSYHFLSCCRRGTPRKMSPRAAAHSSAPDLSMSSIPHCHTPSAVAPQSDTGTPGAAHPARPAGTSPVPDRPTRAGTA